MKRYFAFFLLYIVAFGSLSNAQTSNVEFTVSPTKSEYELGGLFPEPLFLSVGLVNENVSVKGIQFKYDPVKGFDFPGYPKLKLGARVEERTSQDDLSGWGYKHAVGSPVIILQGLSELQGTKGEVLRIELRVDETLPSGVYPMVFREIKISDENGNIIKYIDKVTTSVTVKGENAKSFLGNAHNTDKVLDVQDPNDAASMILGKIEPNKEVDVNWDGECTIGDLVQIIEMTKNQK